ncbi:MAG TPA: pyrroline-5-carboxylate reductase [Vicinamibacteria bacterium]|nr:pyrroline-5-carboxylate reductase [Vicinamibacteria bacterium]
MERLNQKLAILGLGKMGSLLAQAFLARGLVTPGQLFATVKHADRAGKLDSDFPFSVTTDNRAAAREAGIVLLAVKPQAMEDVMSEVASFLTGDKLVVSILASVPTSSIERHLQGDVPVVRAMPNTPCSVGEGMTVLCRGRRADETDLALAAKLFDTVGRTLVMDEKHMDAVTGLSASGPAYIYVILESLAEAGVKLGLPRDVATLLAAQTTLGAAKQVLESGAHPALLKDEVTTPAGCTIDGLLELEEGKLRVTLIKAVVKAGERARDLYTGSDDS